MKKIQLFLFLMVFLFAGNSLFAQQIDESFEGTAFPPAGWSIIQVKGSLTWERSVLKASSGSYSAFMDYDRVPPQITDNWLITPKIFNVQAGDKIDFDLAVQYNNDAVDTLYVMVSTSGNSTANFTNQVLKIAAHNQSMEFVHQSVSLDAFAGQDIYVGFRNYQEFGNGMFIDKVQIGSDLPNDVATSKITVAPEGVVATGTSVSITQTIKNLGQANIPAGVPVKYTVNGGTAVSDVTTSAISPGSTTTFIFTGSKAFVPTLPGDYLIKVFTDRAEEINRSNDTLSYLLKVQAPIVTFPYFEDFENTDEWTQAGTKLWVFENEEEIGGIVYPVINPSGKQGMAAKAFLYKLNSGETVILRSPLFNFTSVAKPMVNFYVAKARGRTYQDDKLEILVSLDGGVTYEIDPVLYRKGSNSDPRLETLVPTNFNREYVPATAEHWRHEIVDLSRYAGQANVLIAIKGTSDAGNNLWIDNVEVLAQDPAIYQATRVVTPGQIVTGPFNSSVTFNTLPSRDTVRMQGHNTQPSTSAFATNTTATSGDGTITTQLTFVYPRYQTIAFSGNSIDRANYDISLDISGISGVTDSGKLYILKRSDRTGDWVALATTRNGTILTATGLTKFSEFAIGDNSRPVSLNLISFSGILRDGQSLLDWQTANEKNVSGFEVERKTGDQWYAIGSVPALNSASGFDYYFTDKHPEFGQNYYRLRMIDLDGTYSYSDIIALNNIHAASRVLQNIPNPFTHSTRIKYFVSKRSEVKIMIYDAAGAQVEVLENSVKQPGTYEVRWNAANRAAGNYFYKVIIGNDVISKQMIKIK